MDPLETWHAIVGVVGYIAIAAVGLQLLLGILMFIWRRLFRSFNWEGKHLLVTGGSKGLGREVAILAARRGASVTVLAREQAALLSTVEAMEKVAKAKTQRFLSISCDVTQKESVAKALNEAREKLGPLDVVVTSAGAALPGLIHEVPVENFQRQVSLNYLGTVYVMQDALRSMIERKRGGKLVLVSSTMAVCAFAGYGAYAPTKAAIKSFADTLRNELSPFNISVHHFLPPTMKTEGLENENKIKPEITKLIEGSGELLEPSDCAKQLFAGIGRGDYQIECDFFTYMLRSHSNGTAPRSNVFLEALASPLVYWIIAIVVAFFDYTVRTFKAPTASPSYNTFTGDAASQSKPKEK